MSLIRPKITALVLLAAIPAPQPPLLGSEVDGKAVSGPPPLGGNIRHRAVAEVPLPRDRNSFGIGEEIEFWVDPPEGEGPEAVIAWHVRGPATVYPVIGPATVVTVGLASSDGKFTVSAVRRDPGRAAPGKKPASEADLPGWLRKRIADLPGRDRQSVGGQPPAEPNYPEDLRAELFRLDALRQGTDTPSHKSTSWAANCSRNTRSRETVARFTIGLPTCTRSAA